MLCWYVLLVVVQLLVDGYCDYVVDMWMCCVIELLLCGYCLYVGCCEYDDDCDECVFWLYMFVYVLVCIGVGE